MIQRYFILLLLLPMPLIAQDTQNNCDDVWQRGVFVPKTKKHVVGKFRRADSFSGETLEFFLNDSVFFKHWTDLSGQELDRPVLGVAGTYRYSSDTIVVHFDRYVLNPSVDSARIVLEKADESNRVERMNSENVYLLKYIRPYVFLVKARDNTSKSFCHFLTLTQKWAQQGTKLADEYLKQFFETLFLTKQIGT